MIDLIPADDTRGQLINLEIDNLMAYLASIRRDGAVFVVETIVRRLDHMADELEKISVMGCGRGCALPTKLT